MSTHTQTHPHTVLLIFFEEGPTGGKRVSEGTKKSLGERDSRKRNLDDLIIITKLQIMSEDGTVGFEEWK